MASRLEENMGPGCQSATAALFAAAAAATGKLRPEVRFPRFGPVDGGKKARPHLAWKMKPGCGESGR